ncbi:MAG TPA: hypothetical protein EYO79_02575 [Candidatus Marinimicrobia bacterium]|nr:hypothetical protein [Candidatus Neomarinimicrobiota bacterium]
MHRCKPPFYILFIVLFSCEPLVTTFDDVEVVEIYEAKTFTTIPDPENASQSHLVQIHFH